MDYQLLIISRLETDTKEPLVALTFYPADAACIKPREYETLAASFVQRLEPPVQLADAVSDKGKRRLKIILRHPEFSEDERRTLGTLYYGLLFKGNPGGNEERKSVANALYSLMCDLWRTDASSEEAWMEACEKAVERLRRLAAHSAG